jgi:dihydroorotate dehydrogenase (fumarate)
MGLPNFGHKYYSNVNTNKLYIQSIYPKSIEDMNIMFNTTAKVIEVNLSCPNVKTSNNNYELYFNVISKIKGDKIVGVKMTPIFDLNEYWSISNLILKYGINFITCSNNVPNCLVVDYENEVTMIKPNSGMGGMSFKSISLSNVYNFHKILGDKVDVIGSGQISNGKDVFEYILCGAKCVQIGSTLLREGVECFKRIENELLEIMKIKKYETINDFYGKIKLRNAKL